MTSLQSYSLWHPSRCGGGLITPLTDFSSAVGSCGRGLSLVFAGDSRVRALFGATLLAAYGGDRETRYVLVEPVVALAVVAAFAVLPIVDDVIVGPVVAVAVAPILDDVIVVTVVAVGVVPIVDYVIVFPVVIAIVKNVIVFHVVIRLGNR